MTEQRARLSWMVGGAAWSATLFVLFVHLGVRGYSAPWRVGCVASLLLLATVAFAFQAAVALGATDPSRPLRRRHGFYVIALGTAIGLPTLGGPGLVDPWETHYAEVAREMLERHDFVSPWWAHDGWFMSKPVLTFWLEAIAMKLFGVHTGPDGMLAGARGAIAHPEWAIRMPTFILALTGSYVLYAGVARTCGRRAGLLGGIALWTMPGFALLAHQAVTDMPLVAGVGAALGLLLWSLATPDAVVVRAYPFRIGGRTLAIHAGHAVALVIALVTLPQIAMLLAHGLGPDHVTAGSPHACTLPGQPACAAVAIVNVRLRPAFQALLWLAPTAWLLWHTAFEERRVARLLALAAWLFASIATMAKGPAGLVVPAGAVLVHALAVRSLRPLLRLELPFGLLLAVTMIGPWYLALYARHGRLFIDELVLRHMLGRTLDHLHDTNEGEDVGLVYFVRQLAYATFPWCGAAILAVVASAADRGRSTRRTARALLFGAAIVAFTLVSLMKTKFHHYVLVALPPIAMLTGLWLDELLGASESSRGFRRRVAWTSASAVVAAGIVVLVGRDLIGARGPAHFILLLTYRYSRIWPSTVTYGTTFAVFTGVAALAWLVGAHPRLRRVAIATAGVAAIGFTLVLVDRYLPGCAIDGGQRGVLAAYYQDRNPNDHGPLVAYQLNWKGENLYTGNHVAIFVSSGAPFRAYLDRRRERGERTVYVVTERARVRGLQAELGATSFRELTPPEVSAEFTLVRAQL